MSSRFLRVGSCPLPITYCNLLLCLFALRCATAPTTPSPSGYGIYLRLPPAFVTGTLGEGEVHDSASLLAQGNAAYEQGEWERALKLYELLIEHGEEGEEYWAALFNAGLTSLRLDRLEAARVYFLKLISKVPNHELSRRARKNLLDLSEAEGKWREAQEHLQALAEISGNSPLTPFERKVHEWMIRAALNPTEVSPQDLEGVAYTFRSRLRQGEELERSLYARLIYSVGELYLFRARSLTLDPDSPVPTLTEQMEEKSQWLLKAQEAYLESIRALDPFWATAAAFRIGYLYESFYCELLGLDPPQELTQPEERRIYEEEVEAILEPLRMKAIYAYEELLKFSRKYAYFTPWITQAEEHLKRLKNGVLKNGVKKPRG